MILTAFHMDFFFFFFASFFLISGTGFVDIFSILFYKNKDYIPEA